MATKTYPLWKPGGPQLRIFLPDFYMKLVRPARAIPPNMAHFKIDMKMSKIDVKNYLTKIYNVPVKEVRTHIKKGMLIRHPAGHKVEEPDQKYAFVTMEKNVEFHFPNLFPDVVRQALEKEEEGFSDALNKMRLDKSQKWHRSGAPTWFSV
ncbi:hypothetical protein RvY_09206 [Ramazzottius varieornatus]|uniref:Large ribosomal subunit protein uL23m n=1 Tax=Ramazzottius varieornatus TaxID=947166 RepID=A0A1D1V8H6_RAMVA|nr:hypothetical protein RvY_09206 [Ramazzottius varieornatus]